MLDGELPYRDFGVRVPAAGARRLLALGGLAGTERGAYRLAFAALDVRCSRARWCWLTGALAARTGGDRRIALLGRARSPCCSAAR